jgi:alcohol dehydrogenase class IV
MAAQGESYRPAFPPKIKPHLSIGLPFPEACAHHITNTFHASKVYIIVSNSISKTDNFTNLEKALGDKVVGVRKGIKPHTPWDDILEIVKDIQEKGVDIIVTLGAGSLTDGAKSHHIRRIPFHEYENYILKKPGSCKQSLNPRWALQT